MRLLRPGEGLGARSPPSRRRLSHRFTVGRETPKTRTTSALGSPRSTAASSLTLRSFEYAFIAAASHGDQSLRNLL